MDESDRMCADLDLCNSERDALRKEVEGYKRALEKLAKKLCWCCNACPYLVNQQCTEMDKDCWEILSEWALSEAG